MVGSQDDAAKLIVAKGIIATCCRINMVHTRRNIQRHLTHVSFVTPLIIPQHFVNVWRIVGDAILLFVSEKCTCCFRRFFIRVYRYGITLLRKGFLAGGIHGFDNGSACLFHGEHGTFLIFSNGNRIRIVAFPLEISRILSGCKFYVKLVCVSNVFFDRLTGF